MHGDSLNTVNVTNGLENDKELREALSLLSNKNINIIETANKYSSKPELVSIPANSSGCGCGC